MLDVRTQTAATLRQPDWYRSATRWTQLTLAEDDPVKFDPAAWIDIFRRTRSNATCLSAGGYVAYYPSKVPLHYVSKFIGDGDPFGELVDGARALGMHVMARVDPHAIHQDAADAHPEWVAHDRDGKPRRHWAFPEVWVTCAYGEYNNRFMPQVVEELVRDYDIDAVFANRWQGHGVCYCADCKARFHAAHGRDLPLSTNPADPDWRAWTIWRRDVLTRMVIAWDEAVKAIKPHASFIPNMGGASLMEFDLALIEQHCPFLVVDNQGRNGTEPVWKAGRDAKRIRATFRDRPVVLITSIGPENPVRRWKDAVTTGPEMQAWINDGTAHGMLPWFTKFNGVLPDTRWIDPVAEAFGLQAQLESVIAETEPACEIAILDATTTLRQHDWTDRAAAEADEHGFYHALVEARLPFEFVSDHAMTDAMLDRFRLLILPNAVCLSDAQCAMIRAWVERGGSLIVAGLSGTRDETGAPRADFGLGDVTGTRMTRAPRGPVKNSYVEVNRPHPLTEGYDGASRIMGGVDLVGVAATEAAEAPFLYVPDFPDLPMEEVYPRDPATEPAVVARDTGAGGRTVHIPWTIGATFWEMLMPDHGRLIANAVRWALGRRPAVEVSGAAVLDVAVREGAGATVVLLMNLTNPMMMKGPIRETWPVGPQTVSVALPDGRGGARARLVAADIELPVTLDCDRVTVTVPGLDSLDAIRFDWT